MLDGGRGGSWRDGVYLFSAHGRSHYARPSATPGYSLQACSPHMCRVLFWGGLLGLPVMLLAEVHEWVCTQCIAYTYAPEPPSLPGWLAEANVCVCGCAMLSACTRALPSPPHTPRLAGASTRERKFLTLHTTLQPPPQLNCALPPLRLTLPHLRTTRSPSARLQSRRRSPWMVGGHALPARTQGPTGMAPLPKCMTKDDTW